MGINTLFQNDIFFIILLVIDLTLRGISLWKSARKDQKYWFVALLVINSLGILPLIYLGIEWYKTKDLKKITVFKRIKDKLFKR